MILTENSYSETRLIIASILMLSLTTMMVLSYFNGFEQQQGDTVKRLPVAP